MWIIIGLVAIIAILVGLYFAFRKAPKTSIGIAILVAACGMMYYILESNVRSAYRADIANITIKFKDNNCSTGFCWTVSNKSNRTIFYHSFRPEGYLPNRSRPITSGWYPLRYDWDWVIKPGETESFSARKIPQPVGGEPRDISLIQWRLVSPLVCVDRKPLEDFFRLHYRCDYKGINYAAGG